ncbi:hypothetical protein NXH76_27495 [Blautia schinkii]|nr:hypothetical protein [Blautia schinkii]
MKRKFIKIVTAALVCAGLLTAAGCGKKDPFTVYEEAAVKTSELKSIASTAKLNMKLSAQGQSIEIGMDMDMKILNPNGDDMQADIAMDMDMLGQNISMNSYYKDGYYYTATGDSKVKYIMDIKEMQEQIAANSVQTGLKKEDFKEISMEKKDKDSLITFTINGETMSNVVDSAMGALSDMLAGSDMEMKIGDIPGTATVNKDNYISAMTMKMPLTMTISGQEMTMDLDMDITYTDPGKDVTVEFPDDLDTYEEIDMSAGALGDAGSLGATDNGTTDTNEGTVVGDDTFSDNSAEDGTDSNTTEGAADDAAEDDTTKDAA